MAFDVGAVIGHLILETKKWDASFEKAAKDQKTFSGYIAGNSAKIKKMGRNMTIAGGAIVGALGLAVKSAVDFNQEMASVATLIPGMTERVEELKEEVQDLAVETGKSTTDISNGLYQVISAFGDTADTAEILEVNVLAAAAGMATTTDAINLTSAVMKGYGDVSLEATKKTADLAFQTVKLGQTTFPELAGSMGKVIPIAAKLGVSQEELFAGFATLTGVTGSAAEVTTQLRGVMASMMKPTKDMSVAVGDLGFASAETMIQELGLQGAMEALIGTTDGSTESVGKLFANVESLPAVFALSGSQAEVFKEKLDAMKESGGAMEEAFKEMSEGINATGFNMSKLKQMTTVLTQRLGDSLAPAIGDIVVSVGKAVSGISDWIKEHPKLTSIIAKAALGIGVLMTAIGPLLMALPGLVKAFSLAKLGIGKLLPGLKTLKGSIGGVSGVLKNMPAIAGAAFVGWQVGRAIGKIELLGKSIDEHIVDGLSNVIDNLGLFQGESVDSEARLEALAAASELAGEEIVNLGEAYVILKDNGNDLYRTIEDNIDVTKLLTEEEKEAKRAVEETAIATKDLNEKAAKPLISTIERLRLKYKGIIPEIKDTRTEVEKLEDEYWDLMGRVFAGEEGWQTLIEQAGGLKDKIKDLKDGLQELDMALEDDAEEWIDMGDAGNTVLEDLGIGIGSIPEEMEAAATATSSIWSTMIGDLGTSIGNLTYSLLDETTTFKEAWGGFVKDLKASFSGMIADIVKDWFVNFVNGVVSGAATAGTAASTLGGGMAALGGAITSLATGIASILPAIATGIATAAEILFAALPEIAAIAAVALAIYAGFMAVNALFGSISGGGGMMDATNRELHNIWEEARNILNISRNLKNITTNIMKSSWKMQKTLIAIKNKLGQASDTSADLSKVTKILHVIKETGWKTNKLLYSILQQLSGTQDPTDVIIQDSKLDVKRNNILNDSRGYLKNIRKFTMQIRNGIRGLTSAAGGATITSDQLVMAHGTPGKPEHFIPDHLVGTELAPGGGKGTVNNYYTIENRVDLNGVIVTDQEYARNRMIPNIIDALNSNVKKTDFQQALGIS